jgi:hypothetical protein
MIAASIFVLARLGSPEFKYSSFVLEGWQTHVERDLVSQKPHLWAAVRQELTVQLVNIERVVPDGPLAKIRTIPIWIHLNDPGTTCAAFHPDANYLSSHNMDARMAHGFEIGNASNFVSWTYEQPWMVLHELSHGFHFLFLPDGFENADVKAAYSAAMAAKRYDMVRHWDGRMVKAYATTNPMEYFAETTEAYFGTNDYFPFVRGELMVADSDGYALMRKCWGDPQKRVPQD